MNVSADYYQVFTPRISCRVVSSGRAVNVRRLCIHPGEEAPCALPYNGLRPADYLAACLCGTIEYEPTLLNRSGRNIVIYHGE